MRYSILCAVSTETQATSDKISLAHQEKTCRNIGEVKGWNETTGPYIIAGKSRTRWVNLSDAEKEIPTLHEMLKDAQSGAFDVLVLYDYNRLRDLLDQVAKTLAACNIQIYSVNQPIEPLPPEDFNQYASDAEPMLRGMSQIISRWSINDLRRKWKAGMPIRIQRGLTPLRVPFGYRWVGKKEPPELDPARGALILQMKDLLLNGRTLRAIADHANTSGVQPPNGGMKWDVGTVRYILSNPFYAGIVSFQKSSSVHDPRRKSQRRQISHPRAKWMQGQGKHKPLWDGSSHNAIIKELERRYKSNRNYAARFPFSGLLVCSVCEQKLYRRSHGHGVRRKVLTCAAGTSHVILPYEEAIVLIGEELARQLSAIPIQPVAVSAQTKENQLEGLLVDMKKRRTRVQEGFEAGLYTQLEASEKLNGLEEQLSRLEQMLNESRDAAQLREEFKSQIGTRLEHFPEWIREDDPQVVHRLLHALCESIWIHPDRRIEIIWRGG